MKSLSDLKGRLQGLKIQKLFRGVQSFDFAVSDTELYEDLELHKGNNRLLGQYSETEVSQALSQYGVWNAIQSKGYRNPKLSIQSIDPFRQRIRILTAPDVPHEEKYMLCEMRVFDASLNGPCPVTGETFNVNALVIDWLLFQDPNASFSETRPPLPGQRYPGLGILRICVRAIIDLARQIGKEAVVNIPEYYHNAVLYHPVFRFFSPYVEGRFLALKDFLKDKSLADASNAVADGQVQNLATNLTFVWKPHEQILGLTPKIQQYFDLPGYHSKMSLAQTDSKFAWNL